MATKNYSLKPETIKTVARLAEATVRTQGSIIDIAVAELAAKSIDENGAIDLPVSAVTRQPRRISTPHPDHITGVRKGATVTA